MKEKLKFKLDAIPAHFGGGYKAKMCARTTIGALDVIGDAAKALKTDLVPENECRPCVAKIGNVLSVDAGPAARCNQLVFGCDLSIVGWNLVILDGDAATWNVQQGGGTLTGAFKVLANDTGRLLLKWPEVIPPSAVGHKLEFALASRGGNPAAVCRTVKATWPIT